MKIKRRLGPGLTVREASELFTVAKEELNLESRGIELDRLAAVQFQSSRGQENVAGLGRILPVDENHHPELTLERPVPDKGRREMHVGCLRQGAERLKPLQVVKVDLTVIFAPPPPALWRGAGIQEPAVGVAPQLSNRRQLEGHHFLNIVLFRKIAVHAVIFDPLGQTLALLPQLLLVEIDSGLLLVLRCCCFVIAWGRLANGERERAPACDIYDRQGRNLQPPFGAVGTAVEEVPQPEGLFATLRNERGILRRDQI